MKFKQDLKNLNQLTGREQKPKQQTNNASQGWWSTTTNWMKKKYFNGAHLLDLALNDEKSDKVSLFGMTFKSNEEARILYSSILWFTYRENLKFYKIQKQFTIKTDVGWGCMVRVGQMMLAHCLRLNLGTRDFDNIPLLQNILNQFISQEGRYSVQKIAQKAYEMFGLKPGDWYSPSEIAHVLSEIENENKQSNLKVIVYDNQFQWCKTLQFLDEKRKKNAKFVFNEKADINTNVLNTKINPGLIIILFRIGYKAPEPQLLQVVINFLRTEKNCIGILGGRPGKAHYIFGTTDKNFIYLDPHCVKETNEMDSFFCSSMFSIPHENIDPSMGLCFYVKNSAQLLQLYDHFESLKKSLPFYSYSKSEMPLIVQRQEPQQEFQKLVFEGI